MQTSIQTITTHAMGIAVNSYLVQARNVFFLIDTGMAKSIRQLDKELRNAGCHPGNLKWVLLTHGDFDHSGNSAFLREQYGARIAMHPGDLENVQSGDMFRNKTVSPLAKFLIRAMFALTGLSSFQTFSPDTFLQDGQELAEYGWDAKVIHLPGHSKGSIGFLTQDGVLFCGDQFENTKKPGVNTLGDNLTQMRQNLQKLTGYNVKIVNPGHGSAFAFSALTNN
jgi:hydroxyacylglutathione hydrolase